MQKDLELVFTQEATKPGKNDAKKTMAANGEDEE